MWVTMGAYIGAIAHAHGRYPQTRDLVRVPPIRSTQERDLFIGGELFDEVRDRSLQEWVSHVCLANEQGSGQDLNKAQ